MGFSIINHPFWGTPIVGTPHLSQSKINEIVGRVHCRSSLPASTLVCRFHHWAPLGVGRRPVWCRQRRGSPPPGRPGGRVLFNGLRCIKHRDCNWIYPTKWWLNGDESNRLGHFFEETWGLNYQVWMSSKSHVISRTKMIKTADSTKKEDTLLGGSSHLVTG